MSDELRFERVIDAPPGVVFEAFTTPGGQEAFYGQDDPGWIVESACDLHVGGVWTVTFGPARNRLYRHRHRFEVIDRPRRLVLATTELRVDGSSFDFATEFTFGEQDGGTLMTMIQTGLPTAELRAEHARGVPNAFDRLERVIRARGLDRAPLDRRQRLRMLDGRFVLEHATDAQEVASQADVLALVFGPDGRTRVRRDDTAEDAWAALWNGDQAHDPQATGMLSAIVAPLAAGELPVWVASSYDGDLILVPVDRLDEAVDVLRRAGHQVAR
jgi:uncharacterized protein YndB with AHSA1/START domain